MTNCYAQNDILNKVEDCRHFQLDISVIRLNHNEIINFLLIKPMTV